jgi:hypothetical protein
METNNIYVIDFIACLFKINVFNIVLQKRVWHGFLCDYVVVFA